MSKRAALEFVIAVIVAALVGVIAHGYVFSGTENDLLLSAAAAVLGLFVVSGLFSLRRTAAVRKSARRRYGVHLTLNETSFLLRTGEHGHAVLTNTKNPSGLWLKDDSASGWILCTATGAELAHTAA